MTPCYVAAVLAALLAGSSASLVARQTAALTTTSQGAELTAVSQCSVRSSTQICSAGTTEYQVVSTPTDSILPRSYTRCHKHGADTYCSYSGGEVQIVLATATSITTPAPSSSTGISSAPGTPTAISDCRLHGSAVYCMWGTTEYQVTVTTQAPPPAYTACHAHGSDLYCVDPSGNDVRVRPEGSTDSHTDSGSGDAGGSNVQCHFHAGVEHCVAAGESETGEAQTRSCEKVDRDYNITLRIGLLFVILATSSFGVFAPIFLIKWWPTKTHTAFLVLKQFGTGIIISTAFIHLYTHAALMFGNSCLGGLQFEATTSAVVMAGIFLSFLVEFTGKRAVLARNSRNPAAMSRMSLETVTVLVLEAGIIFHSILIGITLVVAGDSFFLTLFVVILFHQMFEGIALGSRIAALEGRKLGDEMAGRGGPALTTEEVADSSKAAQGASPPSSSVDTLPAPQTFSLTKKLLLATPFALVTPIGMAIGIGVLRQFNGNNRATILAIGTLDALSAGILIWVGVVEMWAEDWMLGNAELLNASLLTTFLAGFGLVAGMVIMSVLGKWA